MREGGENTMYILIAKLLQRKKNNYITKHVFLNLNYKNKFRGRLHIDSRTDIKMLNMNTIEPQISLNINFHEILMIRSGRYFI